MLKKHGWVGFALVLFCIPARASVKSRCALALEVLQLELAESRDFAERRVLLAQLLAPIFIFRQQVITPNATLNAPTEIAAWADRVDGLYKELEKTFDERFRAPAREIYEGGRYVHFSADIGGRQIAEFRMGTKQAGKNYLAEPEIWINGALRRTQLVRRMQLMSYALRFAVRAAESQSDRKSVV